MIITSKYDSKCKSCGKWTRPGDRVGWRPGEKGVWCLDCAPDDPPEARTGGQGNGKALGKGCYPASNGADPLLTALAALEEAIMEKAGESLTPEMSHAWEKYTKIKILALAPAQTPERQAESRTALKQAIIQAVKLAL